MQAGSSCRGWGFIAGVKCFSAWVSSLRLCGRIGPNLSVFVRAESAAKPPVKTKPTPLIKAAAAGTSTAGTAAAAAAGEEGIPCPAGPFAKPGGRGAATPSAAPAGTSTASRYYIAPAT